jgi:hypothetical protein
MSNADLMDVTNKLDRSVRHCLQKTREAAANGRFEPFKTSSIFGGTAENPQWLGEEPPEIRQLMPA